MKKAALFIFVLLISTSLKAIEDVQVLQVYYTNATCIGNSTVYVQIKNLGTNVLSTVNLTLKYNGVTYPTTNWTGTLAQGQVKDSVSLGNINFIVGANPVKIWSALPNGLPDINPLNDTLNNTPTIRLSGTYTIGGTSPDYATLNDAKNALTNYGVCNPVVFNIRSGNYSETITFTNVTGSSAINTITFQSEALDSSLVTIDGNGTNNTITLNNASNFIFRKITITSLTSTYSAMSLYGNNIQIYNCRLIGNASSNYLVSTSSTANNFIFSNNYLIGGKQGIFITNSSGSSNTNQIFYNTFLNQTSYGINFSSANSLLIIGNVINTNSSSSTSLYTGIRIYGSYNSCNISNNSIRLKNGVGIELSSAQAKVYNNFIHIKPLIGNTTNKGMFFSNATTGCELYNNTVCIDGLNNNNNTTALSLENGNSNQAHKIKYNIFINKGAGFIYRMGNYSLIQSDSNCFYSSGTLQFQYNSTIHSTLNAYSTASGKDAHSFLKLPDFLNDSTYKILSDVALYKKASRVSYIYDDLDGEPRTGTTSCIGADEFTLFQLDAAADRIVSSTPWLCHTNTPMTVRIRNYGLDTITQLTINWKFNNIAQTPYNWTGTLVSGDSAIVTIGSYSPLVTSPNDFLIYTTQPNGTADLNPSNDSVSASNITSRLIGTYTIGGTTPDFATLNAAVTTLNSGICGPVIFKIRDGIYKEKISIPHIKGVSALNTITFESESNDSSKVVIRDTISQLTIQIKCNYLHLNNLTIQNTIGGAMRADTIRGLEINSCVVLSSAGNVIQYNAPAGKIDFKLVNNHLANQNNPGTGLYLYGPPTTYNIYISGNKIEGAKTSIRVDGCDSVTINNNKCYFNSASTNQDAGIMTSGGTFQIENNLISGTFYQGMLILTAPPAVNTKRLIANNFILLNGTTSLYGNNGLGYGLGMFLYNSNNIEIYNNTIAINTPPGTTRYSNPCLFIDETSKNNSIKNNIFYNQSQSVLYFFRGPIAPSSNTFEYNNLYSNCDSLVCKENIAPGGSSYTYYADLLAWQLANNKDAHSLNIKPTFVSATDLHLNNDVNMNGNGISLASVLTDNDGDIRPSTPDIGADEINVIPFANDAFLLAINAANGLCEGSHSIFVRLKNNGSTTLTSLTINWEINNVTQTAHNWTGSLLPDSTILVNIGSTTFTLNNLYNIEIYSTNPNNTNDQNHFNDTIKTNNITPSLNGSYTIGGINPSFPDFSSALLALKNVGICSAVEFKVRNGIYNETLILEAVKGASAVNTITFRSESGNRDSVIIQNSSSNIVFQLKDADYLRFYDMSFENLSTSTISKVVTLEGDSDNNIFKNNIFTGIASNGSSSNRSVIELITTSSITTPDSNIFENNLIKNGDYAVFLGISATLENVFSKNIIDNPNYRGINAQNQVNIILDSNVFIKTTPFPYSIAISLHACSGNYSIIRNKVIGEFETAISLGNSNGIPGNEPIIANNVVAGGTSTKIGIVTGCSNQRFYYNSVNISNANATSAAYQSGSFLTNLRFKNNNFVNSGQGYAMLISASSITSSDYNNMFSNGPYFIKLDNLSYSSMTTLQLNTGREIKSISVDPLFYSSTDLHPTNPIFNAKGGPIVGITEDIEGVFRNVTKPNIGAYETTLITTTANELENINYDEISIYPNPYSGNTQISYLLKTDANVTIEVFNSIGQLIETITNTNQKAGEHNYTFSAKNSGHEAGIYMVVITINNKRISKRIVEMK